GPSPLRAGGRRARGGRAKLARWCSPRFCKFRREAPRVAVAAQGLPLGGGRFGRGALFGAGREGHTECPGPPQDVEKEEEEEKEEEDPSRREGGGERGELAVTTGAAVFPGTRRGGRGRTRAARPIQRRPRATINSRAAG
ncbi:unnamed protein product, partial [Prorocentrum cordatum]